MKRMIGARRLPWTRTDMNSSDKPLLRYCKRLGEFLFLPIGVVIELISRKAMLLVILTIVYYILVTPIGLMKRCVFRGRLRSWRKNVNRDGWVRDGDIQYGQDSL